MDTILRHRRMSKANKLTMEHYFKDPEWFDMIVMGNGGTRVRAEKYDMTYEATGIQPMRCIKCSKPFQKLPVCRNGRTHTYINRDLFDGIILKKGGCHGCK